jgi:hypothetical protein
MLSTCGATALGVGQLFRGAEKTKALLRLLIAELRVNGKEDIVSTYNVPTPERLPVAGACATSESREGRTLRKPRKPDGRESRLA